MSDAATINSPGTSETTSDDGDGPAPNMGCDPDQPPPERMNDPQKILTIQCAITLDKRIDLQWIETLLTNAISHIAKPVERIALKLVDDHEMTQLHQTHSNDNSTTDVLTFENSTDDEAVDVDIAICIDVAQRQAIERDHSVSHELLLYALHGLLHCGGFDDKTDEQSRVMHIEEDRILQAIGVGAIYKRNETGHDVSCENDDRDRGSGS